MRSGLIRRGWLTLPQGFASGSRTTTGRPIRVLSRLRSPPGRGNHSSRGRGRRVHGVRLQVSSLAISVIDQVPHANSSKILELSPPERLDRLEAPALKDGLVRRPVAQHRQDTFRLPFRRSSRFNSTEQHARTGHRGHSTGGKWGADRAERSDRTRPIARKLLIRRPSWWIMDVEAGFGSRPVHSGFKP